MSKINSVKEKIEILTAEKENQKLQNNLEILKYLIDSLAESVVNKKGKSIDIYNKTIFIKLKGINEGYTKKNLYKIINENKQWFIEKLKENGISIKFNTQKIMEICPFNLFVFDYSISAMKKHTISLIEKEI